MNRYIVIAVGLMAFQPVGGAPFPVQDASIMQIEAALEAHRITCTQLIEDYLARVDAYDKKGPALNAVININPRALALAREIDDDFAKTGRLKGPLSCISVAAKDNYGTADIPTTGGNILFKDFTPRTDSTVIRKLREAGAIILLKTNMHEFAMGGTTVSSLGGQTKNPYDLTRTPGGSSGGTGAAVAAGFAAIGLGSDTVNSIRSPASANALVGFRTSKGLVSRAGVMPNSTTQDVVGPLTRSVADSAAVLDVIAGYDVSDPDTAWDTGKIPASFKAYLDIHSLKGAHIGLLKNFLGKEDVHAEVNRIMADAVSAMREAGAIVVEFEDPDLDADKLGRSMDVQRFEFKTVFNDYLKGLGDRAPVPTLHDLITSGKFLPTLSKSLVAADTSNEPMLEDKEYLARLVKINDLRLQVLNDMARANVDFVIYPLQRRLVVPLSEGDQPDRNGIVASLTGFPAITVPAGFSRPSHSAPLGIPIGMDILGRPYDDSGVLRIAFGFEQFTHVRRPPPSVPPLK